jgi:hypothetical protein
LKRGFPDVTTRLTVPPGMTSPIAMERVYAGARSFIMPRM